METDNTTKIFPPISTQIMSSTLKDSINIWLVSAAILIAPLGLVGNLMNTLVFHKMGLTSTTNTGFFCLAICDLFSVLWITISSVGKLPPVLTTPLKVEIRAIVGVTAPLFFSISAYGSWITTIISVERCCCVVFPMKVRLLFTKTSMALMLVTMLIYQIAISAPFYFSVNVFTRINPYTNFTFITVGKHKNQRLATLTQILSYSIPTLICFIVVAMATVFLITTFKKSRKLRRSMTGEKEVNSVSSKDARLISSVILVCIIYIFGYCLSVTLYFCDLVGFHLNVFDPYLGNVAHILFRISYLCQTISCSANILVYLKMNASYRETIKKFFTHTK